VSRVGYRGVRRDGLASLLVFADFHAPLRYFTAML
jgi:hypothetical protein